MDNTWVLKNIDRCFVCQSCQLFISITITQGLNHYKIGSSLNLTLVGRGCSLHMVDMRFPAKLVLIGSFDVALSSKTRFISSGITGTSSSPKLERHPSV